MNKPLSLLFSPFITLLYLLRRPRLWLLVAAPLAVNLLLLTLLISFGWTFLRPLLLNEIGGDGVFWDWVRWVANGVISFLILLFAALITYVAMGPLGAPFIDFLTEKVEFEELAKRKDLVVRPPDFRVGALHSMKEAARRMKFELPLVLFIFVLGFIPFIGAPMAALLGWGLATFLLPLDAFSYAMDRRRMSFQEKVDYYKKHRRTWSFFGLGLAALLIVPCNLLWFPPIAAITATRLYCKRLMEEIPRERIE